jgi:hypothetical protein
LSRSGRSLTRSALRLSTFAVYERCHLDNHSALIHDRPSDPAFLGTGITNARTKGTNRLINDAPPR